MYLITIPDDRKSIRADAVAAGFDYSQCDGGGQRGIDGVSAPAQRIRSGLAGQWMGSGYYIMREYGHSPCCIRKAPIYLHLGYIWDICGVEQDT